MSDPTTPAARPLPALEPVAYMRNWAFRKEYGTKANRPRGWAFYTTSEGKLFDDDVPLWAVPPSSLPADVAGLVERILSMPHRMDCGLLGGYDGGCTCGHDQAVADAEAQARQIAELTAENARLREALDNLLDALMAQDRFGDRALTITGSTAALKWLIEAEGDASTALKGGDNG